MLGLFWAIIVVDGNGDSDRILEDFESLDSIHFLVLLLSVLIWLIFRSILCPHFQRHENIQTGLRCMKIRVEETRLVGDKAKP